MHSRCLLYGGVAVGLALAHSAGAGPFTRTKLGDGLGGGGGQQPVAQEATSTTDDTDDVAATYELAPTLLIGFPVGDYGTAVGTGYGISVYAGYLVHPMPGVRVAIGPALGYETYGAKGGGGSAGLLDVTARARAEYDVPTAPGLTVFGDLGLGLGLFMVSADGAGSQTQTHVGAFELGAGAAFHVMPKLALTGELAYRLTPTDGDGAGRIALAIGGSYAY